MSLRVETSRLALMSLRVETSRLARMQFALYSVEFIAKVALVALQTRRGAQVHLGPWQ
jgi:hypothetical protein